jgi:hypothetical protein
MVLLEACSRLHIATRGQLIDRMTACAWLLTAAVVRLPHRLKLTCKPDLCLCR